MSQTNQFNSKALDGKKSNDSLNLYYKSKRRKHNRVAKKMRAQNARIRKHK